MKLYDDTMAHLRFREDFCEATVQKALDSKPQRRRLPRAFPVAACICLCAAVLFGTAMAASPEFRSLFIRDDRVEETEQPSLPESAETVIENRMESITAQYYKIDGELLTDCGFGSVIPVEKDGTRTLYRLTEDGTLEEAAPSRTIQKTLEYKGQVYDLDMTIYSGDVPAAIVNGVYTPLAAEDRYTIWQADPAGDTVPLSVDLTTWEISDPMENIDFTPPEGYYYDVSAPYGGSGVLIRCRSHSDGDSTSYYYGDKETGEVTHLMDCLGNQCVFLREGNVYSCFREILCVMDENGVMVPMLGEKERCSYTGQSRYAGLKDVMSEDLTLVDVTTGNRLVLEGCSDLFTYSANITENPDGTRFAITNFGLTRGLDVTAIAIVDPESAEMVSLERMSGMREVMCGWLDNDRYLIAGTLDGEWYLCIYSMS